MNILKPSVNSFLNRKKRKKSDGQAVWYSAVHQSAVEYSPPCCLRICLLSRLQSNRGKTRLRGEGYFLHTFYSLLICQPRQIFSKNWPSGPILSIGRNLHSCVRPSVHPSVHSQRSRARVTMKGQCVLLQISLRRKMFDKAAKLPKN